MSATGTWNATSSRSQNVALLLLLMVFLLLSILSSPGITVTLDEPLHYHYGLFVLEGNTDRIDDSSMPVSALNALPQHVAAFLPDGLLKAVLGRFFVARLVTIFFSTGIIILVYQWTRSLYGFVPAVFAAFLYVFDPNIIAHSELVTTDLFAVGMITLSFFLLWKFANTRSTLDGLACASVVGLSQLVKYTAVALFPLGVLALLIHDWPSIRSSYAVAGIPAIGSYMRKLGSYLVITLVVAAFIINLGFLFNRTFTRFQDYQFRSGLFRALQADLPSLGGIPVPLPYPYVQGLDWMRETEQTASRYGNVYLLGHVSKPNGFPGYYFVASALKTPIATQIIIITALGAYLLDQRRRRRFLRDEVFLLLPVLCFTIYFNFFFNAQTGIRYFLVVFPLLYVFSGSLFIAWQKLAFVSKATSVLLLVYLAASVLWYFPYYTPYFNEFVWDKTQTYKYLADSNLEWGRARMISRAIYLSTRMQSTIR